ncbi:3-(cis-5,6-dihydroxycyclohexa-1,3-dien-1-yl)propanoate dehydrogenase [Ornithinimicrobium cryptoxanthini]|uniref:3-(Cis-5,6-dihydroxycyclohexa-1, 3-dien-1-yl)propanoate dehydrogenase n=1 Tax=Ornithinimicrobium cryptoxanthini TaxID=2934161 RepID=A0ABY4YE17_9MICO|nr:3-(cis-5,6-dihydroxycyclohexa-1,3-dien-1-yl)propanoate dehydrogenase [Ornithinimicrobium cryptoxanthini]USQ74852.1 3-(cis-5,6-dihydroxycyclohexa-1,3-dien-1-yl)propanoate dehydrogenase [Ornithinimicrobium cryptoxanthini]
MGWLEGDVALITGAGSGLGRALVDRFESEGARVVAFDRSPERVAAVEAAHQGTVVGVAGDVAVGEDNERAVAQALEAFGRLDTFIGNAGLFDYGARLADTPMETLDRGFDELIAVNVKGCLLGVKAALDALVAASGSVVLTASLSSRNAGVGGAIYTASKHAVVGLVEQLAFELAPEVRVNGVSPGFMRTDIRGPSALGLADRTLDSMPDLDQLARALLPLRFLPDPADYSGHYVQLASRANAAATTGVVVDCDGGFSVRGMPPLPGG